MTVRFDPIAYELIAKEAEASGVPIAQFVRESALIRAMLRALVAADGLPLDRNYVRAMQGLSEEVAKLSAVNPPI